MSKGGFTEKEPQKRLNDGVLYFGRLTTQRDHGKKIGETFEPVLPLRFDSLQIRQSDYELASATGQTIDLKVKTYYTNQATESHKVKIGEDYYDIYQLDHDGPKKYLYWYLQKVRRP